MFAVNEGAQHGVCAMGFKLTDRNRHVRAIISLLVGDSLYKRVRYHMVPSSLASSQELSDMFGMNVGITCIRGVITREVLSTLLFEAL